MEVVEGCRAAGRPATPDGVDGGGAGRCGWGMVTEGRGRGRGDVEGAAGVRWRSGSQGRGAGRGAAGYGRRGRRRRWRRGCGWGGKEIGEKRQRMGAGRPLTYPPLCRQPTVGKEVGPVGLSWLNNNWTHPRLCRLLADGKELADGKAGLCHQSVLCRLLLGS